MREISPTCGMHRRLFRLEILHLPFVFGFNRLDLDGDLLHGNVVRLDRFNLGPNWLELLGNKIAEALDSLDLRRADVFFERPSSLRASS